MAFNPAQRIEFFLAKIAGEDVDISTLTPPVPTNAIEKSLLQFAENNADASAVVANVYVVGTFATPTSVVSDAKVEDILAAADAGRDITVKVFAVASVTGDDVLAAAAASESKVAVCTSKLAYCDPAGKAAYFGPAIYSSSSVSYSISGTQGVSSDTWVVDSSLAPAG